MTAIEKIQNAVKKARETEENSGFPYLAECLRQAGVLKNQWFLPAAQSIYWTENETVIVQNEPMKTGMISVSEFSADDLITAIRQNQAGETEFDAFLSAIFEAGCISYEIDFEARSCTYFGATGENYIEQYPAVQAD